MKKVVLLLLALLVCVSSFCDETESRTIMIAKGAALYPISDWKMTNLQKDIRDGNRTVMTFSNSERPTKLRRNTEMPIIRLINMVKGLEFDSYVVEYNGAYYVVSATDALDNSYLTEVNNYLKERRDFAKIANSEKAKMLPSVNAELQDSILALRNRNTALSKRINEEIEDATKDLTLEQEDAVLELMNSLKGEDESWYKKQSAAARKAIDAIEIFHFTLTKANSVGGHDAIFSFSNNTLKKIKYIDLTAKVKNAVDDYVSCDIRRTDTFKGRITGPLGFGSNEQVWENVIYNWSGSKIELIAMTITYMDGTTLVCDKATSKALMEFQDHNSHGHLMYPYLYGDFVEKKRLDTIEQNFRIKRSTIVYPIRQKYAKEVSTLDSLINVYTSDLGVMERGGFPAADTPLAKQYRELYSEYANTQDALERLQTKYPKIP